MDTLRCNELTSKALEQAREMFDLIIVGAPSKSIADEMFNVWLANCKFKVNKNGDIEYVLDDES